jgi:NmrA-like family
MPVIKSILVVGATGKFGTSITHALAAQKSSLTRIAGFKDTSRPASPETETTLSTFRAQGLEAVTGNGYASPDPFRGFDCIIMALGNHALHQQPTIIDSAIVAGMRHFYPSEFGADLLVGQKDAAVLPIQGIDATAPREACTRHAGSRLDVSHNRPPR